MVAIRTRNPDARELGLASALLNMTGLSAGYFYLRRWGLALASLAVTATVLVLATWLEAAAHPVPWLVVFGVWWAWMIAHGWSLGVKARSGDDRPTAQVFAADRVGESIYRTTREPADDRRGAGRWIPFGVAAVLLAAAVFGVIAFRGAAERIYDAALAAHEEGDCQTAVGHYSRLTGVFQLSLSPTVSTASSEQSTCEVLVQAEQELNAGNTQRAAELHDEYLDSYDTEPTWTGAEAALAELRLRLSDELAAQAANEALPGAEDAYQSALDAYLVVVQEHPNAPEAEEAAAAVPPLRLEFAEALAAYARERDPVRDEDTYRAAIDAYLAVVAEHPDTSAAEEVPAGLDDLYDSGTSAFGVGEYCDWVDELSFFATLRDEHTERFAQRAEESLPEALYECGVLRFDDGELGAAEDVLSTVVDEYPDVAHVGQAEAVLEDIGEERIKQEIESLTDGGTEALPPPPASGSAPAGTVTVELLNDSPRSLELLYTGPETGSVSIDACEDCAERFYSDPGYDCGQGDVPRLELQLEPGTYQMVVRAAGGGVVPFAGSWDLVPGTAYSDCYFITTQF